MDASVAVGLVGVGERGEDEFGESGPASRGRRVRASTPVEESRRRHLQPGAHLLHGIGVLRVACSARVDELVLLGYRGSRAKYAAAFFRNSFSMRSSRSSRWASANWIRSCGVSGGSSPAWSRRYWFTQLPSVPTFTPSSRATWAIGRDPSITSRTASSRNSGLNLRYFLAIPCITFRARSYWIVVREQRGTSVWRSDFTPSPRSLDSALHGSPGRVVYECWYVVCGAGW